MNQYLTAWVAVEAVSSDFDIPGVGAVYASLLAPIRPEVFVWRCRALGTLR